MKIKAKLIRIFLAFIIMITLLASYSCFLVYADTSISSYDLNQEIDDSSILVISDENHANINYIKNVFKDYNVKNIKNLSMSLSGNIFKVSFNFHDKEKILNLIDIFSDTTGLNKVEPNYIGNIDTVESYVTAIDKWWFKNDYGINLADAWGISTGSKNVRVGVIDTGICSYHNDLYMNVVAGKNFIGTADDTNDLFGHGTHVAGIVGANGENVRGVNQNVSLVPLKVANGSKVQTDTVIEAINYAQSFYWTDNQIDILNLSASVIGSQSLYTAISNYAGLFVCSAGNKSLNNDIHDHFPSNYDLSNIISVGASNSIGEKCEFSNYGKSTVDLFAPGELIYSTIAGNGYREMSGTSMAAPFVTGVAALIYGKYPNLSVSQVKSVILENVRKVTSLENICVTGGVLDAYAALKNVHTHVRSSSCKYYNNQQHYFLCADCGAYMGLEKHNFTLYIRKGITTYAVKSDKICTDCGYILLNGDIGLIPMNKDKVS